MTDEGAIAWNMDMITLQEFQSRLVTEFKKDPDTRIVINGDERAFFAQAIYVFDEARKAGFKKVFVITRSR
ncbi:Biopolymer transport protein ExbD/TolR [compost metagenome]